MKEDERLPFLQDMGLSESSLARLIHTGYKLLGLVTFFTKDGPEVRAWTVKGGTKAPQAAGRIHTDFEKGFIKADVYTYGELMKFGNEHAIHAAGKVRSEGHDYVVKDGDIIHFKFNV
jgi:ribosome-binding ATPase YchF (GTP1/OBG family)